MKQWYEELFENSAKSYDQQPFVKGTHGEVDFIEEELGFNRSATILDLGCGTGRHAIELAKRGYTVTAVDLSASQLDLAREKAVAANVTVQFVEADARHLNYSGQFDAVIIVCEGAFPLMETDEMNFELLKNAFRALRQGGVFIPVSYTHLRAHETRHDLVCRLLLEKKKKNKIQKQKKQKKKQKKKHHTKKERTK